MASYTTADIRNIAFVGHNAAGKTTLVEALLHRLKLIGRMGTVEEGNTVGDYEPEEKHHKHSLHSKLVHFNFHGRLINLIDTPGLADFFGHSIAAMPADCRSVPCFQRSPRPSACTAASFDRGEKVPGHPPAGPARCR